MEATNLLLYRIADSYLRVTGGAQSGGEYPPHGSNGTLPHDPGYHSGDLGSGKRVLGISGQSDLHLFRP